MKIYNLDKLIKISVFGFTKNPFYYVLQEKRNWRGKITQKAGVYDSIRGTYLGETLPEHIEKTHVIEGDEVLEKPHVTLYFEGEIEETIHFNDFNKASGYATVIRERIGFTKTLIF
jgi:outer membrane protein assembly factor BamE (lipoprotein component of BamABCDE complex)